MIKISKERLINLLVKEELLYRLESLGVDNWDGYSEQDNEDYFEESLDEYEENLRMETIVYEEK